MNLENNNNKVIINYLIKINLYYFTILSIKYFYHHITH